MKRKRSVIALLALAVIVGGLIIARRPNDDCSLGERLRIEGDARLVETADGLSVVLSSEEGFTVGALFWILRIGNTEFELSRYPEFATTAIEFPIPDEAWPRLGDGDEIAVRYGNPTGRAGSSRTGWAPADPAVEPGAEFGVLRIGEECAEDDGLGP